jgi:hypothetical protein
MRELHVGNADFDWDTFDPECYFAHNYGTLRGDDKQVITAAATFFQRAASVLPRTGALEAIDVGSGGNLYPALMMLPFADRITLVEWAAGNREWLQAQLAHPATVWRDFWSHAAHGHADYQAVQDPLELLRRRAEVVAGSVFALPRDRYDVGTMFFFADLITTRHDEFTRATRAFVTSLKPGAPFAAAFMVNSSGYQVGNVRFPSCAVTAPDIKCALDPVARNVTTTTVNSKDLRDGYGGMMVYTGHRRRAA